MSRHGGNSRYRRYRRLKLLAEYPFCYWCEAFLKEYPNEAHQHKNRPADMATIDHVHSRVNGIRPLQGMLVLSCGSCNQWRARQEEIALGIAELHKRSGRHGNKGRPHEVAA